MGATDNRREEARPPASPIRAWVAAALSLAIPGAGQVLIRRWGRAAIWFAGLILVAGASGSSHNVAVLALMAAAAIDAFMLARADAGAAGLAGPRGEEA